MKIKQYISLLVEKELCKKGLINENKNFLLKEDFNKIKDIYNKYYNTLNINENDLKSIYDKLYYKWLKTFHSFYSGKNIIAVFIKNE